MSDLSELKTFEANYPIRVDRVLFWGEMDAFAHMNNVHYFRYFEAVRIHFLEKTQAITGDFEGLPVLSWTECYYKAPITYPDTLTVGCKVTEIGESHMIHEYGIFSQAQQIQTSRGSARIVFIDCKTKRKAVIPGTVKTAIDTLNKTNP